MLLHTQNLSARPDPASRISNTLPPLMRYILLSAFPLEREIPLSAASRSSAAASAAEGIGGPRMGYRAQLR
jgi:hypothetical protein